MTAIQVFAAGYLFGWALLSFALLLVFFKMIIGQTQIDPAVSLIGGSLLMIGSKLALIALYRKVGPE